MTDEEKDRFRGIINERIEAINTEIEGSAGERETISPDKAIGRLSRLDAMQMQQMALAGKRRLEHERQDLREALERLERGVYGTCMLCRGPIARERLEYMPAAQTCVPCVNQRR